MKPEETSEIHDSALKAAVKHAWGAECCPAKLRQCVCSLFDEADQPIIMRQWLAWGAAVAAVLTMAVLLSACWVQVAMGAVVMRLDIDGKSGYLHQYNESREQSRFLLS